MLVKETHRAECCSWKPDRSSHSWTNEIREVEFLNKHISNLAYLQVLVPPQPPL